MQGRLLLDVVVAQGATVFELLAGEDETLLVRRDAFFVLDLGFDVVDGVGGFDLEGDGFAREGLDETGGSVSCCLCLCGVRLTWGTVVSRSTVEIETYICTVRSFMSVSEMDMRRGCELTGDGAPCRSVGLTDGRLLCLRLMR